jgi:hypothetical protein
MANDRLERPDSTANFTYGTRVRLFFKGVQGLTQADGKVYPDLALCVVNAANDTLLHQASTLETASQEGLPATQVVLETGFLAVFPIAAAQTYTAKVTLYDTKGSKTAVYELPFTLQPNNLLELRAEGLRSKDVYLWDNTAQHGVTERRVYKDHHYILFFEGVEGLTESKGLVHPTLSVDLVDRTGQRVVSESNFIPELTHTGVAADKIRQNKLYIPFQFYTGPLNNPYQFRAVLGERDSKQQLEVFAHFEIL